MKVLPPPSWPHPSPFFLSKLGDIWQKKKYFFSMSAEAKAREYSKGACNHILVPATKVAKVVCLVFSMKLLVIALACLKL